ncbi:DUF2570 domain-containing protein [Acaricomes phytoseiuli]|uniref:DUF2570 domain-containing protein n=1 Tax=Acaricomes phytoseiuli TaxID=291968 RepID=UPI00222375CE|nr:DUF2570 domain-containing protein [Acaricomes phytoseiuli]MCW1249633.1 DUF2570 domain-containing protein [Acaricomes phytoseiuli]
MEWVTAVTGIAAFGFAVWSWQQANASKAAKAEAQRARGKADESVAAAQKSAQEAERLTKEISSLKASLSGPPLELEAVGNDGFTLRNRTPHPLTIEQMSTDCGRLISGPEFPFVFGPYSEQQLLIVRFHGDNFQHLRLNLLSWPEPLQLYVPHAPSGP